MPISLSLSLPSAFSALPMPPFLLVGLLLLFSACTSSELWDGLCAQDLDCAFDFRQQGGAPGIDAAIRYYQTGIALNGLVPPFWMAAWTNQNKTSWASISTCPDALQPENALLTLSWLTRYRPRLTAESTGGACPLPTQSAVFSSDTQQLECACVEDSASCSPSIAALVVQDGFNFWLAVASGIAFLVALIALTVVVLVGDIQMVKRMDVFTLKREDFIDNDDDNDDAEEMTTIL